MRGIAFRGVAVLAVGLLSLPFARGQEPEPPYLSLVDTEGEFNQVVDVPLRSNVDAEVQGVVAAFDWDGTVAEGVDLIPQAVLAEADTVVLRIEPSYMVLGVVMDADPSDPGSPEVIPPGDQLLALAQLRCGTVEATTEMEFQDGTYNTVDGGPLLDNIVVVGGLSIGEIEGLALDPGVLTVVPTKQKLILQSSGNSAGSVRGEVQVLMSNNFAVEGFVLAVCHDTTEIALEGFDLGADSAQADFTAFEIDNPVGGTFGVVIDLIDPMEFPPNIEPAEDNHIATITYSCAALTAEAVCHPLRFCDMEVGDPLKENLIVQDGISITANEGLELVDDGVQFCCQGEPPREICNNGEDDNGNGLVDCDDPECFGHPACLGQSFLCGQRELVDTGDGALAVEPEMVAGVNGELEVCFFLLTTEDDSVGTVPQNDHVQGFSMSVQYCADILSCVTEDFDISGTILEALNAEFVSAQCNDTNGELIIGVLVDALPPFDGATIPPAPFPQRMGCMTFKVSPTAQCGNLCPIEFVDGLKGRGDVPIKNLMSIENYSFGPELVHCNLTLAREEVFIRGDCNFSVVVGMENMAVDISDAAAVVSFLFLPGGRKFYPSCLDACDCQNDGRVDLADAICILQYLFQFGRFPPYPGPGLDRATGASTPMGPDCTLVDPADPTSECIPDDDDLDCKDGGGC